MRIARTLGRYAGLLLILLAVLLAGCLGTIESQDSNGDGIAQDAGPGEDAGPDAGPGDDGGLDAGPGEDAVPDAGPDAGPGYDGGLDAGTGDDAGPGEDAGGGDDGGEAADAGADAGSGDNAGGDQSPDAGTDADDPPECVLPEDCRPLEDGDVCNGTLDCVDGQCRLDPSTVLDCDDGNVCTDDGCHPQDGCHHQDNTADCDDGDACTREDVCSGGICRGAPVNCHEGNPCTDDFCDSQTGCYHVNNQAACDDGNSCTGQDACSGGQCRGRESCCLDGQDNDSDGVADRDDPDCFAIIQELQERLRRVDFDGDGRTDLAKYWDDQGQWTCDVHLSNGSAFSLQRFATRQGGYWLGQQWRRGDFDGDGRTDLAKFWKDQDAWTCDLHLSSGSEFVMERWATRQGGFLDSMRWLVGDFNGDGRADFVKIWNDGGQFTADAHLSTGSGFEMQRLATGQGGYWEGMRWQACDFTGDGRTDLAKFFEDGGQWTVDVHRSTGSALVMERWATRQGALGPEQRWFTGDFDGDLRCDFMKIFKEQDQLDLDVHLSTGSGFVMERWATRQGAFWDQMRFWPGDFDGDGRCDLAKFFDDGGLWTADVHRSTGTSFEMQRFATRQGGYWETQRWLRGDFDGDGRDDLLKHWRDDGRWTADAHLSDGAAFGAVRFATRQGACPVEQNWLPRDVNVPLPLAPMSWPGPLAPLYWGTQHANLIEDRDIAGVADLGLMFLRIAVNPQALDRNRFDAITRNLWSRGMTPFYILMGDVNNPPRDLAAWEAFADASAALARHVYELSPRAPVVWEIWNEPHNLNFWRTGPNVNEYAQMAYRTALRLRQTVPHLVVAPGASNLENLGLFWIADSLDLRPGLLDLLDGLSVHGYEPTGRAPPEARFSAFDQAVALTTARGRTLPVVVSEWGWTVGGGAAILPELKAAYDARMLLLAYLQNIPILIHYQWRDMTAAPEDRYGLVDQWYNPRPSHAAVARLTARLSGFAFQGRIPVGHPGDYVLHFTNGNGASRAAMWTTGNPHQILVPNPAGGNAGPYPVNQAPQVIDLPAGF